MKDTPMRSAFCTVFVDPALFIPLTKQQLLHGRCQYDEYVSLLHMEPYIDLRVFVCQLYSQNEGTLQAKTPGEGGCSGLIIDAHHIFFVSQCNSWICEQSYDRVAVMVVIMMIVKGDNIA